MIFARRTWFAVSSTEILVVLSTKQIEHERPDHESRKIDTRRKNKLFKRFCAHACLCPETLKTNRWNDPEEPLFGARQGIWNPFFHCFETWWCSRTKIGEFHTRSPFLNAASCTGIFWGLKYGTLCANQRVVGTHLVTCKTRLCSFCHIFQSNPNDFDVCRMRRCLRSPPHSGIPSVI